MTKENEEKRARAEATRREYYKKAKTEPTDEAEVEVERLRRIVQEVGLFCLEIADEMPRGEPQRKKVFNPFSGRYEDRI